MGASRNPDRLPVLAVFPRQWLKAAAARAQPVLFQVAAGLAAILAHLLVRYGKWISAKPVYGQLSALVSRDLFLLDYALISRSDQVRYNFYVPPVLFDNQHAPQTGSFPIPSKPVTPFPGVVKYLPPDRAAEAPKSNCASARAVLAKPNPHASKMLTVYGENFSKTEPVSVFFGSDPSPYVEVRCTEVLGCLPPENQTPKRRPIVLVRGDGVVFPSNVMYP